MASLVRISSLTLADILVYYALFVMQNYLTQVWDLSFTRAAMILNIWNGVAMGLPLFVLFFRDWRLGDHKVLAVSCIAYTVGIGFVTLSVPSVLPNPCKQLDSKCVGRSQRALFYTGMALIALGMAGNKISIETFIAYQTGKAENANGQTGRTKNANGQIRRAENGNGQTKNRFGDVTLLQILGVFLVVIVAIVGAIGLPYVKPWKLRFGIPAICAALATILFFSGFFPCCRYEIDEARGSPITKICRVFVACFCNICRDRPLDDSQFHRNASDAVKKFLPSCGLRCLEKAAIVDQGRSREQVSVQQVEDAKIAVRMVPMWLTFIICGIVSSIGNTYFVEQADKLDRHVGTWNVPLTALLLFHQGANKFFNCLSDCLLNKWETRGPCGIPKRYGPAIGIAIAMIFSILCCITAAKIEKRRLNAVRKHNLFDQPDVDIPMRMYWLLFQFFLLAGVGAFFEKSVNRFYKNEAPDSMGAYLEHFARGVFGLGFMFSALSVHVVGKVSEKGGKRPNWFQKTLNKSRLDRYYWVLSVMSVVNLIVFVVVACCYRYKPPSNINNGEAADAESAPPVEQEEEPENEEAGGQ